MAPETMKTVVVTGASRGIGRAVALTFARAGYGVWALARSEEALESLRAEGGEAIRTRAVDVADESALLSACQAILATGTPRVLVNNAGITVSAPLTKTRTEDLAKVMAVNVTAPFILCRELMPAMASAGGGRVINIGSIAAVRGAKYTSAYCASKHALLGLTRALAVEYARKQVTVNNVNPGWVETDMFASATSAITQSTGRSPEQAREALASMNAMGRIIQPEEVAALCLFLASDAAAGITGAAYAIDGGEVG
ncbi:SDR family NAD(P)-dependent oxidoreductase [Corallococcus sp. H22C18031201]|uniref:SDR family NAD(P)-dependent oxidoreductase n=1 Tax=Citreicoccus inhibens TaxID=2849499 RepID=UPI000E755E7C|nr:SDR family oxidoreductase [Citreicoccus inhibens]MBU8894359.1 SDR family oxidoreductase [Citreicoccus inhibens]RJS16174.1 SDR family NAD(P)-dependent oxidoreductase [Corallococcus sp. H22C18031201]